MLLTEFYQRYAAKLHQQTGEPVSPTQAEAEVVRILQSVAHQEARKLLFGIFDLEELTQQGVLFGFEPLLSGKYDFKRPLAPFLHTHIRRRLLNFRRDHFLRPEAPCRCCDSFNPPAEPCQHWRRWHQRNSAKASLAGGRGTPEGFDPQAQGPDPGFALVKEITAWVDETWPAELRQDFIRLQQGVSLPKARKLAVTTAILAKFGGDYADAA